MVTCDECGKTQGSGDVGSHWICDDCNVQAQDKDSSLSDQTKDAQQ